MAVSGTTAFNLDFTEIAEEAWERAGREMRSGYDLRTARRSMNLLTIEWANRGINMWTIKQGTGIAMVKGQASYSLPSDCIDIIEHNIRTGTGTTQADISVSRVSVSTYSSIPNKNIEGRPLQIFVQRLGEKESNVPTVTVWPVPDKSSEYTLEFFYLRRIEDAGNGAETADMPFRFLPCLVAGLAYYIAMKVPELAPRIEILKQSYEEQFALASTEDREKTSAHFVPRVGYL
jgi:hypothetical protein